MSDSRKKKSELISELQELRARVADLQQSESECRRLEKILRMSEEKYRQIIENAMEGVWAIDTEGRLTYVNPRMAEIFGYSKEEMLGKSVFSLVDEKSANLLRSNLERRKRGIKDWYDFPFLRKDGTQIYTRVAAAPIIDGEGNFQGAIAIVADITGRKRAENALRESEERYRNLCESLEATVRAKVAELLQAQRLAQIGQMVSVVAHEIRNPLQNIQTGVDTIRMDLEEDKEKLETLEWIDKSVGQLNNLVSDLLDYSKPIKLRYSPQPTRDVVDQALKAVSDKLRGLTVHLELEREDEPIRVDADKIIRVLVNLLTNAADAMPEGGHLRIRSQFHREDGGETLRISVSDTGQGIEEQYLERVQEPFFTTKRQGTGLGIPFCKKIIDAHGGTLRIESKPKEGTTVDITLPVRE